MSAFYRNWVTSMLDLQSIGDGDLPSYVPRDPRQGDKAPTWAAIAVSVPWEYWARTGDASMLPLGLNTTKRLIDFWQKHLDTAGLVTLGVYGDWAESPRAGPKNEWYGNFDTILDHLSGMAGLYVLPHTRRMMCPA